MKTATSESEKTSLVDWRENSVCVQARQTLESIRHTMTEVRGQLESLQQAITGGDEKLVSLRADQIVNGGNKDDERYETLVITIADQREQLRNLESEIKALALAERKVESAVREVEREARAQAAQRLLEEYQRTITKLEGILNQAEAVNDRLIALDSEFRKSDLAEAGAGGKGLLLLLRAGAAWTALKAPPIFGNPVHISDWRKHIRGALGEL